MNTIALILRNCTSVLGFLVSHRQFEDSLCLFQRRRQVFLLRCENPGRNRCQTTNCLVGDIDTCIVSPHLQTFFPRLLIAGGTLRVTCKSTRSLHDLTIDFCHTQSLARFLLIVSCNEHIFIGPRYTCGPIYGSKCL